MASNSPAGGDLRAVLRRLYYGLAFWLVRTHIKGRRNVIQRRAAFLKNVTFRVYGNDNSISIAPGAYLKNVVFYIRGDHHRLQIGAGCRFNRGGLLWFEDQDGSLEIGAGTTFEDVHIAVTEAGSKVHIGKDCLFAYDIDIRTGDSHPLYASGSGERINPAQDVFIADHVWVAAHVNILKGVTLQPDSVVATGATVVKSPAEAGVVVAGNPASVVKRGVTWGRSRQ